MPSMTVKLTWDNDLGPNWMNEDNLKALLFGSTRVREEAIEVTVLDHTERKLEDVVPNLIDEQPRSMEEIARSFGQKIREDRRFSRADQFGFTIDSTDL